MTIDLRTCVPGQLLKDGRGNILEYKERIGGNDGFNYKHLLRYEIAKYDETFTDDGIFGINSSMSNWNIVEILPLDKLEQPKPDTHPSVAWWESCPWITDRKPNSLDGDVYGRVYVKPNKSRVLAANWSSLDAHEHWIHLYGWQPLKQTPREKALALIAKHKDSSNVGVWVPTPDEWDIIREGLTE